MGGIFICYRRSDSEDIAARLYEKLVKQFGRRRVFRDIYNIALGLNFDDVIRDALDKTDVLLVVIGDRWDLGQLASEDDPVRREVEQAMARGIRIIPVLVRSAKMPARAALPRSIAGFERYNALSLRGDPDFDHDIARLIDALREPLKRHLAERVVAWVGESRVPLLGMFVLCIATLIVELVVPHPVWPEHTVYETWTARINRWQLLGHLWLMMLLFWYVGPGLGGAGAATGSNADNTSTFRGTYFSLIKIFVFLMWLMYLVKVAVTFLPCSARDVHLADGTCPRPGLYTAVRTTVVLPFMGAGWALFRLEDHCAPHGTKNARMRTAVAVFVFGVAFLFRLADLVYLPDETQTMKAADWSQATLEAGLIAPADFYVLIGMVLVANRLVPWDRWPGLHSFILIYAALQPVSTWATNYPQNACWIGIVSLFLKFVLVVPLCNKKFIPVTRALAPVAEGSGG